MVDYFKKLNVFSNKYKVKISVVDNPDLIKNIKTLSFSNIIDELNKSNQIYSFDSDLFNSEIYLKEYFNIGMSDTKNITLNQTLDKLKIDMRLSINTSPKSYSNVLADMNKITFINNLLINNNESYHIKFLKKFLKDHLSKKIADKDIREFFLKQYVLPIFFIINIKFSGAQFVGTTKHAFKDNNFKDVYIRLLNENISHKTILDIYEYISEHIVIQYNKFGNQNLLIKNKKKLLLELERFDKFDDCLTKDNELAELFLVEGDSARSTDGRDESCQALYTLGGKTLNSLIEENKESLSLQKIKNNVIFRDIIKILDITPGSDDISNLRFNKILIMTDADTHGYHISSILIGNLMILSPKLIKDGHVYIVISPLYNVKIPKIKHTLYLKSDDELVETLIKYIYNKRIRLYKRNTDQKISNIELVEIVNLIMNMGNSLQSISAEIKIPGKLIESLYGISDILLKKSLSPKDLIDIKKSLSNEEVFYEKEDHVLIISLGVIDYIIPLYSFRKTYDRLNDILKDYDLNKYVFDISFQKENFEIRYQYSLFEIYTLLTKLKNDIKIYRNKGLGSLNSIDRKITCMSPDTRIVKKITNIGDLSVIYGLLGNDSDYRKERLSETDK